MFSRVLVIIVAAAAGLLAMLPVAAQQGATAERSFDPTTVAPGGSVTVTIAAADYGQAGGVTETLPDGFTYVSSSLADSQVKELSGNQVRFTLQGEASFTYNVTASSTAGPHTFSGKLRDFDKNDHTVGGATMVTVESPPDASARRSFDPTTVAPGGSVMVTIDVANYGSGGGVTETLPPEFSYVSSSLPGSQVTELDGGKVRFTLQGDTSFTYTVMASTMAGAQTFSGMLRDFDKNDHTVGGATMVTVESPPDASARRSFSPTTVAPGRTVRVTIAVANYGQAGGVTETLPDGFTYVSSSLPDSQVTELDGGKVRFTLQRDTSFTYSVTASSGTGSHIFSGTLRDFDRDDHRVDGAASVTVRRPSTGSGGTTRQPTSTPVPTATPTPAPTATPQPTATPTPPAPTATAPPPPTPEPGPPGAMGDPGEKGERGERGEKGDQGDQGEQGESGRRGEQGEQGIQGDQGAQGEQGSQGVRGGQGEEGDQGPPGPQGAAGAQGEQGSQGDTGPMGEQGGIGEKGPAGGALGIVALVISILVAVLLGVGGVYIITRR